LARPVSLPVASLVVLAMAGGAAPLRGQSVESSQLMAAFVARFPQFVQWPEGALGERDPLVVCVAEPDPFGEVLDGLLETEQVSGHSLEARRLDDPEEVDGCHLLFISPASPLLEGLIEATAGRPILTVGEGSVFLDEGGMISLRIFDRRIRFEVNAAAAGAAGLGLSSQLLGLALDVRTERSE
jgi:hypothetical protein